MGSTHEATLRQDNMYKLTLDFHAEQGVVIDPPIAGKLAEKAIHQKEEEEFYRNMNSITRNLITIPLYSKIFVNNRKSHITLLYQTTTTEHRTS